MKSALLASEYLDSIVKLEAQERAKGYADEVIASNVDVCYQCLPPTANSNTFIGSVKKDTGQDF